MRKLWDMSNTTPKSAYDWSRPVLPTEAKHLVYAGASSMGSHAVRLAQSCQRAFALSHAGTMHASDRTGRVTMFEDSDTGVRAGPFVEQIIPMCQTIWMARGTLIHVACAHYLITKTLERDGTIVVCGRRFSAGEVAWYTAEEAIECAAALTGPGCHRYALPAARRMIPQVKTWADELLETEQPVAIESQLAWHLDIPWAYTARYDLLTCHRVSRAWRSRDYKTSTNPSKDKVKYGTSAQLHGQDQMGRLWVRDWGHTWGGVVIVLMEDTGSDAPGTTQEVNLPQRGQVRYLAGSIERAIHGIASAEVYLGNPFACSACSYTAECAAAGELTASQTNKV